MPRQTTLPDAPTVASTTLAPPRGGARPMPTRHSTVGQLRCVGAGGCRPGQSPSSVRRVVPEVAPRRVAAVRAEDSLRVHRRRRQRPAVTYQNSTDTGTMMKCQVQVQPLDVALAVISSKQVAKGGCASFARYASGVREGPCPRRLGPPTRLAAVRLGERSVRPTASHPSSVE